MKKILGTTVVFFITLHWSHFSLAAPLPTEKITEAPQLLKITVHMLEDGEKKSSQVFTVPNQGSAAAFHIQNNKKFVRNFIMPEQQEGKKVLIHLHECSGEVSQEQLANVSSVDCRPEIMSRLNVEATLNEATMAEAKGPEGQKQEYFIFVEKVETPVVEAQAEPVAPTL